MELIRIRGGIASDALYIDGFIDLASSKVNVDQRLASLLAGRNHGYTVSNMELSPEVQHKIRTVGYPVVYRTFTNLYSGFLNPLFKEEV